MSHVACCDGVVTDLDALKVAAERKGFVFRENQTHWNWYGTFLNDWTSQRAAVRKGVDPKTFGKGEHALRLKDHRDGDYEVGVCRDGDGYRLVYDNYGAGARLERAGGADMTGVMDEYLAVVAERQLEHGGFRVEREEEANVIRLIARK